MSQQNSAVLFQRLQMNEAFNPPQDILSTKSIVLIDVPMGVLQDERNKLADQIQLFFAEVGIDAVVYFAVPKFYSVGGMTEQIPNDIIRRDIKNLIFISILDVKKDFVLGMGPFNGKDTFYDKGANFWIRRTTDLTTVFDQLRGLFKSDGFSKTNLLVSNSAEFFEPSVSGFRQAYATLPSEFVGKKIAIPKMETDPLSKTGPLLFDTDAIQNPEKFENQLKTRVNRLNLLANTDSTLFVVVDLENKDDAALRRAKVDYVLHYVEAEAPNVYRFLPFKGRKDDKKDVLVKFFLRDVRTNNAYLGELWDANPDWTTALNSFLDQIERIKAQKGN
ncbi:MAG: hypothetical protein ACJAZV_001628 [Roseivirga sp.]|jgi:hypothetical protein